MAPLWLPPRGAGIYAVMALSTSADRGAAVRELSREYRPAFKPLA
jgi:hypothetical protein